MAEEEQTGENDGTSFCWYEGGYTWDFFGNFLKERIGKAVEEMSTSDPTAGKTRQFPPKQEWRKTRSRKAKQLRDKYAQHGSPAE